MRTHKFTIPEGSSHFVYRTQSQNIYCLIDEESNRIYKCPCKGDKEFSHSEFVPHVMKWHKGISPLLKH